MSEILKSDMHSAFIGLGSNQGDRRAALDKAVELLREIPETTLGEMSAVREYPAEGVGDNQPPFLNAVLRLETELQPLELLHKLQVIERQMGRASKGDNKARVIDLDILSFGEGIIIHGKNLIVPHPRMHLRRFVLEPLAEIGAQWVHPKLGKPVSQLLEALTRGETENVGQNQDQE